MVQLQKVLSCCIVAFQYKKKTINSLFNSAAEHLQFRFSPRTPNNYIPNSRTMLLENTDTLRNPNIKKNKQKTPKPNSFRCKHKCMVGNSASIISLQKIPIVHT